jgi:hypothetical protein
MANKVNLIGVVDRKTAAWITQILMKYVKQGFVEKSDDNNGRGSLLQKRKGYVRSLIGNPQQQPMAVFPNQRLA